MMNNQNQDPFDDNNEGYGNQLTLESARNNLHIWHENIDGQFVPCSNLTLNKAIMLIKNDMKLHQITIIDIDMDKVSLFIGGFTRVFSWGGTYWPVSFNHLIIPRDVEKAVQNFIKVYGLSNYRDFVWYLIARLQVFYNQRIAFGNLKDKKYTNLIYESRENYLALQRLVKYELEDVSLQNKNPLTLTINQIGYSHTIHDPWVISYLVSGFIREFLTENGKLNPNWKEKIASFECSHAIKDDFEHIHRNFSIAFMEFLQQQHIIKGTTINADYLNPVVQLLNITQYPFIKKGEELTSKHIKSVLKTIEYNLPVE